MEILRGVDRRLLWRWGAVGILGLMALIMSGLGGGGSPTPATKTRVAVAASAGTGISAREEQLASRLENILGKVQGAGQVWVSVTLSSGPAEELAQTTNQKDETVQQSGQTTVTKDSTVTPVLVHGGTGSESPVVVQVNAPSVAGVLVVAQGASNAAVRLALSQAVQTVLNLPAYRIKVEAGEVSTSVG